MWIMQALTGRRAFAGDVKVNEDTLKLPNKHSELGDTSLRPDW